MSIDAFVLRYDVEGEPFTAQFLASADFDLVTLKAISRDIGISPNKAKNELIQQIAVRAGAHKEETALRSIIEQLIAKKKGWTTIRMGNVPHIPHCANPETIIFSDGKEGWYGPITCQFEEPDTYWYIRQKYITHWDWNEIEKNFQPFQLRWLIFARVKQDAISLHWRGFSYANTEVIASKRPAQFEYWRYIPEIFDEIQEQTHAKIEYINLHNLILQKWWDAYRNNSEYVWTDRRIRAESGGVSLNAHAGAVYEIEAGGIKHLANTIRKAVERELAVRHGMGLPEPEQFDEAILQTLIREYGTLSYEFSLEQRMSVVFRAHTYFGQKQQADSSDKFPHLHFHTTDCSDLQQLAFVLAYLRNRIDYANSQPKQSSLFG